MDCFINGLCCRMVNSPDKIKRVVGIALNNLNITANKSCYKFRNDVQCDLRNNINSNMSNKPQSIDIRQQKLHHTITYPTDPNQPYDFRAAFLKDRCPGYQVLKFDPNFNSGNNESDVHNKREQQPQPQHNLILNRLNHQLAQQQQPRQHIQQQMQQSQQHKTTYNELQRPVQQQRPLNIVGTVDRNENTNCFSSNAKFLTSEEDGPRAGEQLSTFWELMSLIVDPFVLATLFSASSSSRCCTRKWIYGEFKTSPFCRFVNCEDVNCELFRGSFEHLWHKKQKQYDTTISHSKHSQSHDALPTAADDQRGLPGKGPSAQTRLSFVRGYHAHSCGTSAQKLLLGYHHQSLCEFNLILAGICQFLRT